MIPNATKRGQNESEQSYIERLLLLKITKKTKLSWAEISDLIYNNTGRYKSVNAWKHQGYKLFDKLNRPVETSNNDSEVIDELKDVIQEYKKERIKTQEERTQNQAYVRRIAREESIIEIAKYFADTMSNKKILPEKTWAMTSDSTNEAILQLSDWHYGIEVNNYWNKFNPDICEQRITALRNEVIRFCQTNEVRKLHIVNLSDLIAGRIHSTIRLESRCDVISQTMRVAELLAEFISDVMINADVEVEYYDCLDNHSRLEPIKSDSLELESLVRIIPWYLKLRLEHYDDITIHENEYSDDIITFDVMEGKYRVAGVHGHKDRPNKVIDSLTLMTKTHYDLILSAHLHHFSCDEKNETLHISNGSLMGTDTYAKDLRLSSKASQNIILVNEDSVAADIHRIILN